MTSVTAIIINALVTIGIAIVSVKLALGRFRSERWWERKAEAYSKIVEALHTVVEYNSLMVEVGSGTHISEEEQEVRRKEARTAYLEVKKATGMGAYIISNDASLRLKQLGKQLDKQRQSLEEIEKKPWVEVSEDSRKIYEDALVKIRDLAKKDLGIEKLSFFGVI
jgi:hypothetical protein